MNAPQGIFWYRRTSDAFKDTDGNWHDLVRNISVTYCTHGMTNYREKQMVFARRAYSSDENYSPGTDNPLILAARTYQGFSANSARKIPVLDRQTLTNKHRRKQLLQSRDTQIHSGAQKLSSTLHAAQY